MVTSNLFPSFWHQIRHVPCQISSPTFIRTRLWQINIINFYIPSCGGAPSGSLSTHGRLPRDPSGPSSCSPRPRRPQAPPRGLFPSWPTRGGPSGPLFWFASAFWAPGRHPGAPFLVVVGVLAPGFSPWGLCRWLLGPDPVWAHFFTTTSFTWL